MGTAPSGRKVIAPTQRGHGEQARMAALFLLFLLFQMLLLKSRGLPRYRAYLRPIVDCSCERGQTDTVKQTSGFERFLLGDARNSMNRYISRSGRSSSLIVRRHHCSPKAEESRIFLGAAISSAAPADSCRPSNSASNFHNKRRQLNDSVKLLSLSWQRSGGSCDVALVGWLLACLMGR